jgi:hypothetical protein
LSFPYTLRESLIIVEPDQKIKLRLLNSGGELIAVHTHGHHATITHYDGVEHNPVAQIMRDVFDMAPAQRLDLTLETVNDGKHSYGEGDWLIHDHREKGITTNGMAEGGSMSSIVYKSYLNEVVCPRSVTLVLISSEYFTKEYYERRLPVWQDLDEGPAWVRQRAIRFDAATQTSLLNSCMDLIIGLIDLSDFRQTGTNQTIALCGSFTLQKPKREYQ